MSRLARASLLCLIAVAACKKDKPTGPAPSGVPARDALNGDYNCGQMFAFYPGPQGTAWYSGSCRAYTNITIPSRVDSMETHAFHIDATDRVTRLDFEDGAIAYDTASGELVTHYAHRIDDFYTAGFSGSTVQLRQEFVPFDFSGDGQPDSLILVFNRTSR